MWRLLLGTMGVKSLVQGLNAAATAGFEPRTVWSEVRRRTRFFQKLVFIFFFVGRGGWFSNISTLTLKTEQLGPAFGTCSRVTFTHTEYLHGRTLPGFRHVRLSELLGFFVVVWCNLLLRLMILDCKISKKKKLPGCFFFWTCRWWRHKTEQRVAAGKIGSKLYWARVGPLAASGDVITLVRLQLMTSTS